MQFYRYFTLVACCFAVGCNGEAAADEDEYMKDFRDFDSNGDQFLDVIRINTLILCILSFMYTLFVKDIFNKKF